MAIRYQDPDSGGFGYSDNPDLSNDYKKKRFEQWQSGQGGVAGGGTPEAMAQQLIDSMFLPYKEAFDRAKKFETDNPFFFDELLAKSSAQERYDPYYNAELTDFVSGIERQRTASMEDEKRVLTELSAQTEEYIGSTKRALDQAIQASENGYAGAGLFFSGARERKTGQLGVETKENLGSFLRGKEYQAETATLGKTRTLADLAASQNTGLRRFAAEKETAFQTDIEQQRKEAKAKYELERQQFIGYPLAGGSQSFTNMAQYI